MRNIRIEAGEDDELGMACNGHLCISSLCPFPFLPLTVLSLCWYDPFVDIVLVTAFPGGQKESPPVQDAPIGDLCHLKLSTYPHLFGTLGASLTVR
eukprot:gene18948-biopygen5752